MIMMMMMVVVVVVVVVRSMDRQRSTNPFGTIEA